LCILYYGVKNNNVMKAIWDVYFVNIKNGYIQVNWYTQISGHEASGTCLIRIGHTVLNI